MVLKLLHLDPKADVTFKKVFGEAVVLHFGDEALVFDKGCVQWSEIWDIKWCKGSEIAFPVEDDPNEYPEYTTSVRIERFGNTEVR